MFGDFARNVIVILIAIVGFGVAACSDKKAPLAELTKAEGPIDRQVASGEWSPAAIGAGFFLGDAARTADGGAELTISSGSAKIAMQPRTILRFGGKDPKRAVIGVELGAIDLSGTGSYALDIGDVKLSRNGSVRVTARGQGQSSLELTGGEAQITSANGQTLDLAIGTPIDLSLGLALPADAGVLVDAAVIVDAPPPDAPEVVTTGDSTVEIKGKKAEVLEPGEKVWKPLAAGPGTLAKGAKLRVGAGTTAKITSGGASIEIGNASRIEIGTDLAISLEAGAGKAMVPINGQAKIKLPNKAELDLKGTATGPGVAQLNVGPPPKVSMLQGTGKLTAPGAALDMKGGESATVARNGKLTPLEPNPSSFDFTMTVGETATLHDPAGKTAVQFQFNGKCPNGGVVEMDSSRGFRSSRLSAGKDSANLMVRGGSWFYQLRCTTAAGDDGAPVASGTIFHRADEGRKALLKGVTSNEIDADGRAVRIGYQNVIPNLVVKYQGVTGSSYKLFLANAGKSETFEGGTKITVPGAKLREGTSTLWFERDGVKGKVTTLTIEFDQTAPQVYIESPIYGQAWVGDIDVRGAVLIGWTASVGSNEIPIDQQRRFKAKITPPVGTALAIKLEHPKRGVHYYLRRARK